MSITVPEKDNQLLYAAGDVIAWIGPPNVGCPVGFEDVTTISGASYACCGWVDVSGYIFKLDETIKDIPAAGVLTPIRSILTGGVKTIQAIFLEALNPYVRALYDDVPVFPLATSALAPATGNIASYVIPDPPFDNRYSLILDSVDGAKAMRFYAPYAKVTVRGNDQTQQSDITMTDLTWTLYPGTIDDGTDPAETGVAKRFINYGKDMSDYFPGAVLLGSGSASAHSSASGEAVIVP